MTLGSEHSTLSTPDLCSETEPFLSFLVGQNGAASDSLSVFIKVCNLLVFLLHGPEVSSCSPTGEHGLAREVFCFCSFWKEIFLCYFFKVFPRKSNLKRENKKDQASSWPNMGQYAQTHNQSPFLCCQRLLLVMLSLQFRILPFKHKCLMVALWTTVNSDLLNIKQLYEAGKSLEPPSVAKQHSNPQWEQRTSYVPVCVPAVHSSKNGRWTINLCFSSWGSVCGWGHFLPSLSLSGKELVMTFSFWKILWAPVSPRKQPHHPLL